VVIVRRDVSEGRISSIIRVEKTSGADCSFAECFSCYLTAIVFPSLLILSTLMMEAIHSSKSSVLTRATRHHIPEDGILHVKNVRRMHESGVQALKYRFLLQFESSLPVLNFYIVRKL
jgi:hypothetical protein